MRNIVLVGFMGTGKTAVAKKIAENRGMLYVSTDDLIEKKENLSISDIFENKGEGYFRRIEKEVIREVSKEENQVIDAGGGVVIDQDNMAELKKSGIIVCLWAAPEVIYDRTKKCSHRPLLNVDDPMEKIRELLEERREFYNRADRHVDTSELSLEDTVEEVEKIIKNKDNL